MGETAETFAQTLETCFSQIAETRMEGVPILNRAIAIEAVATRAFGEGYIAVLVTPWFMNAIFQDPAETDASRTGAKRVIALPAGRFEFIRGHEEAIGSYWMCSLYSPMFEFEDHAAAVATAAAAMEELFGAELQDSDDERDMAMMWRGETPLNGDIPMAAGAEETDTGEEEAAEARPAGGKELSRRALLGGFRAASDRTEERAE